ncbi:UPF0280 family protein [Paroceanicella profunda]|uniref:UPF0280 family protein n=1 Tax=Paroceanicella profunda TaxID=2579971 RepID=A0A5B8FH19_9RHOB|nr:UPF0280 family protein [Paroceanicella profunda]QDL91677.1 UPF0280 family protein [Paroceanicella profunda]
MSVAGRFPGAVAALLPDGQRLHLQHGPIDLVIGAEGAPEAVVRAHARARAAFAPVLETLAAELPRLRAPDGPAPEGPVARSMVAATAPFAAEFITPMAAVAGAVADHVLAALIAGGDLSRAYVNNGGDIALHLAEGEFRIGICENPETGAPGGVVTLRPGDGVGGIATSGWRGRSHSRGIADAVTVLAASAAEADAAATMIANFVDLPWSPLIDRAPADTLSPDSDLGTRLVTTGVGPIGPRGVRIALARGRARAEAWHARGLFTAAYLSLAGERETVLSPQDQKRIPREAPDA